jgi:Fe-S protein assembly chaperone HscA
MSISSSGLSILSSNSQPETVLGIDLGTTYSLAAYVQDGQPILVRDSAGESRVASVIAFQPDGGVEIGQEAKAKAVEDPTHTAYSIKRLIGRGLDDLRNDLSFIPYQIREREYADGRRVLHVAIDGREHTPEELSSLILMEVVRRADRQLGRPVRKAVITVPAYFDESQRQATRDAGRMAGLDVVRIVNEPTAAALAYGLGSRKEGRIAVYDFGGGTFDCSILSVDSGVFKVLATHGDTHLGGDDIDRALMTMLATEWGWTVDSLEGREKQSLRDACERVKIELSTQSEANVELTRVNGESYRRTLTRAAFDATIEPLVSRTLASCKAALADAGLRAADIDDVVMVGGSSRIPLVRQRVEEVFGRVPHTQINPDEVVAAGAAVQGSILGGQLRQILLLDITPLSLGIETMGGAVSRLINRNSTIPVQATERFTTFVDNQTGVDIHVLQGERELARDCRSLGRFKLTGIPPMPAGLPQIDVSFLIDANGLLQVSASEIRSGRQASIEIHPSQGLNRDEVESMIRQSIDHAREDFHRRRLIDLRNKAETNLRATERGLASAGDRLTEAQRALVQSAVSRVMASAAGDDPDVLQSALDELDKVTMPLAELLMESVAQSVVQGKRLVDE